MALAIDLSNYTGAITSAKAVELYNAGVRRAIVQVVNPTVLVHRQQIPNLVAAGIEVQAYVYVWFSAGEEFCRARAQWACTELDTYPAVRKVWLDCEQSGSDTPSFDYVHRPVTPQIRASVGAVQASGRDAGIYTAAWWWIPGASNSQEWAALDLWDANYDLDPDIDPVNYGGWVVPRMTQYQGDTSLVGVPAIDLDAYEAPVVPPPPPLPIEQVNALLSSARETILQAYYLLNP